MNHLTMEQLLATREPGLEPQVLAWRNHLDECELCRSQRDQVDQRIARIKALPTLRPARDLFPAVRISAQRERQQRLLKRATIAAASLAAAITIAFVGMKVVHDPQQVAGVDHDQDQEVRRLMARAQQLQQTAMGLQPNQGAVSARTVEVTESLEDKLTKNAGQIEAMQLAPAAANQELKRLAWRERVGLLGAYVDVRLTDRYVGF